MFIIQSIIAQPVESSPRNPVPGADKIARQIKPSCQKIRRMYSCSGGSFISRQTVICDCGELEHKSHIMMQTVKFIKALLHLILGGTRNVSNYNDDWIHFDTDNGVPAFLHLKNIPFNQPFYPADFRKLSRYVRLLTLEFRSPSSHTPEIMDGLMRGLLCSLDADGFGVPQDLQAHRHYVQFSRIRTRLYNNPSADWSARKTSVSTGLSLSYFQHLYKKFFGCPFQQDVIHARLEQAKFYLSSSNMSIRSLSEFCGYENELHFMRQFKKFEGMMPSEFRNGHR